MWRTSWPNERVGEALPGGTAASDAAAAVPPGAPWEALQSRGPSAARPPMCSWGGPDLPRLFLPMLLLVVVFFDNGYDEANILFFYSHLLSAQFVG